MRKMNLKQESRLNGVKTNIFNNDFETILENPEWLLLKIKQTEMENMI